ncbi:MAG: DUF4062 domain-containing protein [Anaerolineae bacterium]|nr:DUF4062 domain-containing protein [Anaerolineae bacterium]
MRERPIRVFVSATPDLEPEREVIGEALARFPVPLAWEIARTPRPGEQTPEALALVQQSDLFLVLLGEDAGAPVGAELLAAQRAELPRLALLKDEPHTPAGQFFRYSSVDDWQAFRGPEDLRRLVLRWLAQEVLREAIKFGLQPDEAARLIGFTRDEQAKDEPMVAGHGEPQGAQDGAVIVSARRPPRAESTPE